MECEVELYGLTEAEVPYLLYGPCQVDDPICSAQKVISLQSSRKEVVSACLFFTVWVTLLLTCIVPLLSVA